MRGRRLPSEGEGREVSVDEKKKYRVTLPIDLGDGAVHHPGEILELDLDTAKAYGHALIGADVQPHLKKAEEKN